MECLIGIKGKDFVLLATDSLAARSIVAMKKDQVKMFNLSDKLLMSVCGAQGDTVQFAEFICKNVQLYKMRNGYNLGTHAAAHFTRRNMAESLRSRSPYQVNLLIAGHDDKNGASLFFMDYLGSMVEVPFGAHGYPSYFALSVMDCHYRENMTEAQAISVMQKCIDEICTRFILDMGSFKMRVVNKEGIKDLPDLKCSNPATK